MSMSSELASAIEESDFNRPPTSLAADNKIGLINDITLTQRMVSACSGSLITSLVVTPFDVIRIRIQQQELLPKECCSIPSTNTNNPGVFWVQKNYCSSSNCSRINSTFQGFSSIAKKEGLSTLWRGLSLTLIMAIPSNIIYFTGYEYIRDHSPIRESYFNPLFCGAFARTMAASFVSPIELLKTRLQSIPAESITKSNNSKILHNLLNDTIKTIQVRGLGIMFTGLQITLWRDVPFSGIYWSSYETCKSYISNLSLLKPVSLHKDEDPQAKLKIFTTSFLSGSISGTIAALCTNPFDVGKTRLQLASINNNQNKTSMFRFLITIYRNEGLNALYAGIAPRILKIAPSCAIMISSYEIGKTIFASHN